ncbi:hypothetical protein EWB00_010631 [Schistosoma japonicum]|uniref:Uncharacterized protein n=2 Tax=Schistosoma japonicum TaxID=6182 RepID=A0A4Z2DN05_SCHJA|nr:hypothetical protein EWB00_010631 [Schistosoma japonicum]TNN17907.1 hypothetical protein EWB00_010631 [Schistosoma japonicum]TNN17908.1 hypothetical protein EWB00_010631 [Schistosoma japonicum]TNN17909.1 hypothetical protein EWB00_010631 [Schistosoma japonicum]
MLSAKLRFLRGLAPVSFDDSILQCSTLQNKYEVPKGLQASFVASAKLRSQHFQPLHEVCRSRFPSTVTYPAVAQLVYTKDSSFVYKNKAIETKNQSCQTEICNNKTDLESLSSTIDQMFHKLNCHALKSASESKAKHFPKLWLDLSELNYSPAQYNLGVWYEIQASKCLFSHDNLKRYYTRQASYWYNCAVQIDSHPLAAYNLACLILNSEESTIFSDSSSDKSSTLSVTQLMKLAADGNVKQAKKYLSEQCITDA